MFKIREENSREALEDCAKLGKQYYEEVEYDVESFEYGLNFEPLESMVEAGILKVVTIRDELDLLVGFSAVFLVPEFTNGQLVAKTLFLYIVPHLRGGRLFIRLMDFIENLVEQKGAKVLMVGFKKGKGDNLVQRLGYSHEESIFYKRVGE